MKTSAVRYIKKIAFISNYLVRKRANWSIDWSKIVGGSVKFNSKVEEHEQNKVLVATSLGGYEMGALLESTIAVALKLRGAEVDVLLCDGTLTACQLCKIETIPPQVLNKNGPLERCSACTVYGNEVFQNADLSTVYLGKNVSEDDKEYSSHIAKSTPFENIPKLIIDGISVGEHAYAGALRYFARGDLNGEPYGEKITRQYLNAAILTMKAIEKILTNGEYSVVLLHHGIYVPQGIIVEVANKLDVRVVTWNPAYRKQTFIFSHERSYHHTMISEPNQAWENMPWDSYKRKSILSYLDSRRNGKKDWIWFHDKPVEDINTISQLTSINFEKPCIGIFTNVMWDAQLHYKSNAFNNMLDWLFETIDRFINRPDLECIIRIHPAEIRGAIPSRQPLKEEIDKHYPNLPPHIKVLGPESQVSTYAVAEQCNAVIIYNTKTGIEVASRGIPVIVAGEAWIRGKGFSYDVNGRDDYYDFIERLPLTRSMSKSDQERALKYAYHFFFRRMIELPLFEQATSKNGYKALFSSFQELAPGENINLDIVCSGILNGDEFIANG